MKVRKSNRRLSGALTASLALWIALIPLFSAIHMAMVPHVYCAEHRHFHEVVTVGEVAPSEDTDRATASLSNRSMSTSVSTVEECPFVDLAIRQGMVTSRWLPPNLFNNTGWRLFTFSSIHISWPILDRAPKHSPPPLAA